MSEDKLHVEETIEQENEKTQTEKPKKKKTTSAKTKENKKIKTLQEKLAGVEKERDQLKDQNLRKIAEFENYKRRTEKEFLAHLENANENLITELLPAIDDFERFLEHARKDENSVSLKEGVSLVHKKIMDTLAKKGLKVMESVGQEFDAEKHQALVQVDSEDVESGHIVDEHLKGYVLNEKVIRHAQVLVAK